MPPTSASAPATAKAAHATIVAMRAAGDVLPLAITIPMISPIAPNATPMGPIQASPMTHRNTPHAAKAAPMSASRIPSRRSLRRSSPERRRR